MSLTLGPVGIPVGAPSWAKLAHPAPAQRSTRYPVTPTVSVDAVQLRLIWLLLIGVAVRAAGVVGAVVSGAGVPPMAVFMSLWMPAWLNALL